MANSPANKSRPVRAGLPLSGGEDTTMSSIFTIRPSGPGAADVPSVTQLLERRKLEDRRKPPRAEAPGAKPERRSAAPKIQPAKRRTGTANKLIEWKKSQLTSTADPLGRALLALFESGARTVLFLGREQVISQDSLMSFEARAYAGNSSRLSLWLGLKWSSTQVPQEFWEQILEHGFVELRPGGTQTLNTPLHSAFRSSFGAMSDENLTILRVGQNEFCRGLLVVFSAKSPGEKLSEALKFLSRPLAAPA